MPSCLLECPLVLATLCLKLTVLRFYCGT
jgi:hypothetical protein